MQPIHFPVPWARAPEISSLSQPERVRELIESFGLRQMLWNDATSVSREWLASRLSASGPPMPLGLHVILGSDLKPMMENVLRNFDERRIVVIQGVFARP